MRKSYDKRELAAGTAVELEHTGNVRVAEQIAKDHLDEDPKYYSRLAACGMLHNGYAPNFRLDKWTRSGDLRWYHGTGRDYGEAILRDGYVRARKESDYTKYEGESDPILPLPGRVYVSSSLGIAAKYGIDATLFEQWDDYDSQHCYVFEVEIGDDTDVRLDEDTIANQPWVMKEANRYTKVPNIRNKHLHAKALTMKMPSSKAIALTDEVLSEDGYVNLAVVPPLRVIKAWRYDISNGTRGTPEEIEERFKKRAKKINIKMRENSSCSYYVWSIDKDGNYIESEGVSGPHEKQNAMAYARIYAGASRVGQVVTRGSDPLSKSFEIIEIYKAGKR